MTDTTKIVTPSGQVFTGIDLEVLPCMVKFGFVRHSEKPFRLKSGIDSHVYVFGREDLTDNVDFEWLVGRKLVHVVWKHHVPGHPQPCLIGLPTAGTPLAQAAAMVSREMSLMTWGEDPTPHICHRIMREALKEGHGVHHSWVNGDPDFKRHEYWIVDNVVTDGKTKIEAADRLEAQGYPARQMPNLIFVDRQQGALQLLQDSGFQDVIVVYNLLDLTYAFGELKLWPKGAVKQVEEEIEAHQFK